MHPSATPGRILIVANELAHFDRNGGIGSHNWLLANTLSAAGWKVGILYCGPTSQPDFRVRWDQLAETNRLEFWHLDSFELSSWDAHSCPIGGPAGERSHRAFMAIDALSKIHPFDLIEFADWQGYGFRAAQARKHGVALQNTRIIVKLHGSSQWCREGNRLWIASTDELLGDYAERYAFEHADVQLAPCRYMLQYAQSIGWRVRDDARVLDYPYPNISSQSPRASDEPLELVFFGRLETRKGLKVFLEAVRRLPAETPVSFLGASREIDGVAASQLIAEALPDRHVRIETGFHGAEALSYLAAGNRLAVMPSLVENSPFTVIECAAAGIPFVASAVGGIPELIREEPLRQALLFEPTPARLAQKLREYLERTPAERRQQTARLQAQFDIQQNHAHIADEYQRLLPRRQAVELVHDIHAQQSASVPAAPVSEPLVSVVVPFYNLGPYLPDTLASLRLQSYRRLEVFVVDDGSTDPDSLKVWEQMRLEYPAFKFIRQENQGLSGARNTALKLASGDYFLPVDADNIAAPHMIERLVAGMERRPALSALSCYHRAFAETSDIAEEKFCYVYRPTGGPFIASCIRNVYGDANAIFRTSALRAVGGYEADQRTGYEDWELFVKLAKAGYELDVYPDYLFYYRHREQSMLRTTSAYLNQARVVRQFYSAGKMPRGEQMALWSALIGLEEKQRQFADERWRLRRQIDRLTAALKQSQKNEDKPMRAAVRRVKQVLKRAPYYGTVSAAVKQLKGKAA